MKGLLLALLLVSLNAHAYKNEPDGFRGLKWGAALADNQSEMTLVEEGKGTNYYTRKDDKLLLGPAELKQIAYGYYDGQLKSVIITTEGYGNQEALIETITAQFGRGYKPNRYMEKYLWRGNQTTIFLSCQSIRDKCSVIFSSKVIEDKEEAELKAKAESSAQDF